MTSRLIPSLALALVALTTMVGTAPAQNDEHHDLLARADSLFDAGSFSEARVAYGVIHAADPTNSRAVYRLGLLAPAGSDEAIELFERYTDLEADDAWGWIALAESYADAGDTEGALLAYDAAVVLAPNERDAVVPRAAMLHEEMRDDEARDALDSWLASHRDDAEAWRLLARVESARGDLDGETAALERLVELDPLGDSDERLDAIRARDAAALSSFGGASSSSDGSSVARYGVGGDIPLSSRSRLGLQLERVTAGGAGDARSADRAQLTYALRAESLRLEIAAGLALREEAKGRLSRALEPIGRVRARWDGGPDALGGELRLQRSLQDATASLLESGVVLEEALAALDVPLADDLRLRLLGSGGSLLERSKRNWRGRIAAGPELDLARGLTVGARYDGTWYAERASGGYYAPALTHTLEATAYGELATDGPFTLAADVGVGVQQVAEEVDAALSVSPALRGWGSIAWAFAPSSTLALELEGYNLVGGSSVAGGSDGWSYGAVSLWLRWAL